MSQRTAHHFRGMEDQELQHLAESQQRSANDLQRKAGQAQRNADAARKELRRREQGKHRP